MTTLPAMLFHAAMTAAAAAPELSLSQLLHDVADAHPGATAARARADARAAQVGPARAWEDPFVAVGPDEIALHTVEDHTGATVYPLPVLRAQVSQSIPFPGKLAARGEAAQAEAAAAEADAATIARGARLVALQTFLEAVYLERSLVANAQVAAVVDEIIASAQARYLTGGAAHHDVLLAVVERKILDRDRLIVARRLATSRVRLNELRGLPAGQPIGALVDDVPPAAPPATLAAALRDQPETSAQQALVDAAAARARGADLARFPDVVVQGMGMASFMPDEPSNVGAMIGVNVPLFTPWKQADVARAAAREQDGARADQRALALRLEAEWVDASNAHRTAVDTVRLYEESVLPATHAAVESSRAAYASGQSALAELLAVVRASIAAELELEAARIDVRLAAARMHDLLSGAAAIRLAPSSPTLFGGGAGMGAAGGSAMPMGQSATRPAPVTPTPTRPSTDEGPAAMPGGM